MFGDCEGPTRIRRWHRYRSQPDLRHRDM